MTDGKCVLKPFEGEKKIKALKIFALAFICFAGIAFCFLYAENYGKMDEVYTPDEGPVSYTTLTLPTTSRV